MDFMVIPDLDQVNHAVLVIVDLASDFTVAVYACEGSRPNAAAARKAFDQGWLLWAGPPLVGIEQDLDSAFMGSFESLASDLVIALIPAAPEAHWQMGRVERKIRYLKEMSTTIFDVNQVRGPDAVAVGVHEMANACNALVANAGLSPEQWVLGSGRRVPASLANPDNDPAVVSRVAEGDPFWRRLRLQQSCSEAFFRAANSTALRRCLLARTRPQPGPFQQGELLMYWRNHNLKHNLHAQ